MVNKIDFIIQCAPLNLNSAGHVCGGNKVDIQRAAVPFPLKSVAHHRRRGTHTRILTPVRERLCRRPSRNMPAMSAAVAAGINIFHTCAFLSFHNIHMLCFSSCSLREMFVSVLSRSCQDFFYHMLFLSRNMRETYTNCFFLPADRGRPIPAAFFFPQTAGDLYRLYFSSRRPRENYTG
jgi:hypothetical protein